MAKRGGGAYYNVTPQQERELVSAAENAAQAVARVRRESVGKRGQVHSSRTDRGQGGGGGVGGGGGRSAGVHSRQDFNRLAAKRATA